MKVSGFTFLKNAKANGYPFTESIRSILPIVDEFICVIGASTDGTREIIEKLHEPKIRIIDTIWNDNMRDRGFVYGQQKMIGQYNCTGDWAFYLEADEIVHESDLPRIRKTMENFLNDSRVEALHFDFLHFYGTANQIGIAGYRQAPRIIKTSIRSIAPDGLFWVVLEQNKKGRYPNSKHSGAKIYHYGHCRGVLSMNRKLQMVGKYWGSEHACFKGYGNIDLFELRPFLGTHPFVIQNWIMNDSESVFSHNTKYKPTLRDIKNRVRFWIETKLNIEISKKHFKAID